VGNVFNPKRFNIFANVFIIRLCIKYINKCFCFVTFHCKSVDILSADGEVFSVAKSKFLYCFETTDVNTPREILVSGKDNQPVYHVNIF